MSTKWRYLFPTVNDLPSGVRDARRSPFSLAEPRVSIYCVGEVLRSVSGAASGREYAHGESPWLFGSFEPLYDYIERTGKLHWGFFEHYPTGEGQQVDLGKSASRFLLGDVPLQTSAQVRFWTLDDRLRTRVEMRCQVCDLSLTRRVEKFQMPLLAVAKAHLREMRLVDLMQYVGAAERAAKRSGC